MPRTLALHTPRLRAKLSGLLSQYNLLALNILVLHRRWQNCSRTRPEGLDRIGAISLPPLCELYFQIQDKTT
jgi:hypothetical protein